MTKKPRRRCETCRYYYEPSAVMNKIQCSQRDPNHCCRFWAGRYSAPLFDRRKR